MKIKMIFLVVISVLAVSWGSDEAASGVVLTITGEPGSSIIEVSVTGSGVWAQDGDDDDINGQTEWSSEVVGPDLATKASSSYKNAAPPLSGSITLINNGDEIRDLAFFIADDPGVNDDLVLISRRKFSSKAGKGLRKNKLFNLN